MDHLTPATDPSPGPVRREPPSSARPALRRAAALDLAADQGGVVSRAQLATVQVDRRMITREVAAGRWRRHGRHTVATHTGSLEALALRHRALWEVGQGIAQLDGVSALQAVGLRGFEEERIFVSVQHNHNTTPVEGVVIKKVIRRVPGELIEGGPRRTRPDVAAIRAATWAVSDRQAALILVMVVQQRLTTGARLVGASVTVRRRARRAFIHRVARDIADGAHSLGELDFAMLCRSWGLPEPSRQVLRRGPRGRIYLDVAWEELRWAVEIDGAHHFWGLGPTDDTFRQNELVIAGDRVLRITLLGLRLNPDLCGDQLRRALRVDVLPHRHKAHSYIESAARVRQLGSGS